MIQGHFYFLFFAAFGVEGLAIMPAAVKKALAAFFELDALLVARLIVFTCSWMASVVILLKPWVDPRLIVHEFKAFF
jgi:hypothetical protein